MVANVWKVVAAEGDHVDDGDTLVMLESMKMEIPVLAEGPGVVTKMHVAEGDVVQEGALIPSISSRASADLHLRPPRSRGPMFIAPARRLWSTAGRRPRGR